LLIGLPEEGAQPVQFCALCSQNEPYNIGFFIDKAWQHCWTRVIGRAWLYQLECADKAAVIEKGSQIAMPGPDDRWYTDLLSKDPVRTKKALAAEGLEFLAGENAEQENWQDWIFTRMIVRTRNQEIKVKIASDICEDVQCDDKSAGYVRNRSCNNAQSLAHFLILTIPPTPKDAKYVGKAIADYMATNKVYPLA